MDFSVEGVLARCPAGVDVQAGVGHITITVPPATQPSARALVAGFLGSGGAFGIGLFATIAYLAVALNGVVTLDRVYGFDGRILFGALVVGMVAVLLASVRLPYWLATKYQRRLERHCSTFLLDQHAVTIPQSSMRSTRIALSEVHDVLQQPPPTILLTNGEEIPFAADRSAEGQEWLVWLCKGALQHVKEAGSGTVSIPDALRALRARM